MVDSCIVVFGTLARLSSCACYSHIIVFDLCRNSTSLFLLLVHA